MEDLVKQATRSYCEAFGKEPNQLTPADASLIKWALSLHVELLSKNDESYIKLKKELFDVG